MNDYVLLPKITIQLPKICLVTLQEFNSNKNMIESFSAGPFGLDYESNGYDPKKLGFTIRTVGLSNDEYTISIDLLKSDKNNLEIFKKWLVNQEYVAHNVMFEAAATLEWAGSVGKPIADTYVLFADLATEYRRSWSLNTAMEDLLGIQKEGDKVKEHMKNNKWTWEDINKFDFKILGRYNAIDAFGHWQLFKYFKKIVASYNKTWGAYYWDYHQQDCMTAILLEVESRNGGIYIDTKELEISYKNLIEGKNNSLNKFLKNKNIKEHIELYNKKICETIEASEPEKFTKTGKRAARHIKWEKNYKEAKNKQHFNTNSTAQLSWLFFDMMKLPIVEYTEKGEPSTSKEVLKKLGEPGQLLLNYRDYVTKLKFVTQVKEGTTGGVLKPFVRVFSTVSTRCSGGRLD